MMYCNRCGQCTHISDDMFTGYEPVASTQTVYLNPDTGDIEDWGDMGDNEATGDVEPECPYCYSPDIDWDSDKTEEEATEQREVYERSQIERRAELDRLHQERKKIKDAIDPNREWDINENI